MEKNEGIFEALRALHESDMLPMHMPGHKRNAALSPYLGVLGAGLDITEIEGFDNLHEPVGILREAHHDFRGAQDAYVAGLSLAKRHEGLLASFCQYLQRMQAAPVDIIALLNALYDEDDPDDMAFLAAHLADVRAGEVGIYYRRRAGIADDPARAYLAAGRMGAAAELAARDLAAVRRLAQRALAALHGDVRVREGDAQFLCRRGVRDRDERRMQAPGLLLREPDVAVRGDCPHGQPQMLRDRDRLPADAARGAENRDGLDHGKVASLCSISESRAPRGPAAPAPAR